MTSSKCWQGVVQEKTDIWGWQVLEQKCQSYSGVAACPVSNCMWQKGKISFNDSKTKKKKVSASKYCQQTWAQIQVSARLLLGLGDWKRTLGAVSPSYFRRVGRMRKGFPFMQLCKEFFTVPESELSSYSTLYGYSTDVSSYARLEAARRQIYGRCMCRTTLSVHICCRFGLASFILSSPELIAWIMETAGWQMRFPSLGRWQCL